MNAWMMIQTMLTMYHRKELMIMMIYVESGPEKGVDDNDG